MSVYLCKTVQAMKNTFILITLYTNLILFLSHAKKKNNGATGLHDLTFQSDVTYEVLPTEEI